MSSSEKSRRLVEWHREGGHIRPLTQARDYAGGRIERVDLQTGSVECLYRACGEVPLKVPNDLVFDTNGGFYFTDLGKRRPREMDIGAVYYAAADGSSIREVAYLFAGVEIRWHCDPSLLGDDVPAEAVFQFPGGLSDHLKEQIGDRACATTEFFTGRQDFPNSQGMVEWAEQIPAGAVRSLTGSSDWLIRG